MVLTTWTPNFIDTSFFETGIKQKCKIAAAYVVESDNKGKKELQIEIVNDQQHKKMSIWGPNHKALIDAFGQETDHWIGKLIQIEMKNIAGKTHKVISVLQT